MKSCYSIALDGSWGSGKTFFVRQVKLFLDAHNEFVKSISDEERKIFKENSEVVYLPQVSVYYDAWENDNDVILHMIARNLIFLFQMENQNDFYLYT